LNNDKKKGWGDPPSPRIRRTMEGEIEAKRRFREAEGRGGKRKKIITAMLVTGALISCYYSFCLISFNASPVII